MDFVDAEAPCASAYAEELVAVKDREAHSNTFNSFPSLPFTLFLCASLTSLEVEVADHVVHDSFAPLEGDDDGIVLVAPLQLVRAHHDLDLVLVQDFNGVRGAFQPPNWCSVFLLVDKPYRKEQNLKAPFLELGKIKRSLRSSN